MISGADPYYEYLLITYVVDVSPWGALEYIIVNTQWFASMLDCQVAGVLVPMENTWEDKYFYGVSCREIDVFEELRRLSQ